MSGSRRPQGRRLAPPPGRDSARGGALQTLACPSGAPGAPPRIATRLRDRRAAVDGAALAGVHLLMHPWLPDLGGPSAEAEVDVFAFPHAGASADAFRPLMRQLPDRVALRPLELPGRGRRMDEEPGWQLIPLVAELADAVAKAHARPAVFFGHSMGALLAFETARALRGRVTPRHLVLSGHRGPQLERGDLRGHEDDDATFAEELRRWGGEDATWLEDPGLRELFLPVLRADFRALVAYRFQAGAPLPIPFTVLGGDQDPYLDEAGLDAWSVHTTGGFEKRLVPGAHFFWFRDPQVLARALVEAAEV